MAFKLLHTVIYEGKVWFKIDHELDISNLYNPQHYLKTLFIDGKVSKPITYYLDGHVSM